MTYFTLMPNGETPFLRDPSNAAVLRSADGVVITAELSRRPAPPPDYAGENRALAMLAMELVENPPNLVHKLVDAVMELTGADSTGVCVLDLTADPGFDIFRWEAISGAWALHANVGTSGTGFTSIKIETDPSLRPDDPSRCFLAARGLEPPIYEALLVPFHASSWTVGAVWAVAHRPEHHFNAENARLLTRLSSFASASFGLLRRTEEMRRERIAILNLMEDTVASTRDVNRLSSAHERSEERFRLIVENARDFAILSTDLNRRVVSWNPGAQRLLGYEESEIVGRSADIIFTPEDLAAGVPDQETGRAKEAGSSIDERWHVGKNGVRFWGSGIMAAMHGPDGEVVGFLKIMRDQTERVLAQKMLEQSREELIAGLQASERARDEAEMTARAKDELLAVLSHELRTPLTPVLIASRTLARRNDLPTEVREALEMIGHNVQLQTRFIDDLLDISRIGRGKLELALSPIDVHDAIRRSLKTCDAPIKEKKQRLELDLVAPEYRLQGDFIRLQQVFCNLLTNSSKFTPTEGLIQLRSANEKPGWITLIITDSGIGIDPEALPKIFDKFEQVDSSVTRRFGGLGLGLAISKAIVEGHGGTLTAGSAGLNKGATFTVKLPLHTDNVNPNQCAP